MLETGLTRRNRKQHTAVHHGWPLANRGAAEKGRDAVTWTQHFSGVKEAMTQIREEKGENSDESQKDKTYKNSHRRYPEAKLTVLGDLFSWLFDERLKAHCMYASM